MENEVLGFNLSVTDREKLEIIDAKLDLLLAEVYKGKPAPGVNKKEIRGKALGHYKKLENKKPEKEVKKDA